MPEALSGILLQDFLELRYPHADRARLRGIQARGAVRVNGMLPSGNRRLGPMDYVELDVLPDEVEARSEPQGRAELPVLFESAATLVVVKPAGLTTVPDRTGLGPSVHGMLAALRPGADLRIVHRLDRDTSGCLMLGKGLAAAQHHDAAFRAHAVHKRYVALVHGSCAAGERVVDLALGPDPRRPGKVRTATAPQPGFRAARTRIVAQASIGSVSLVQLFPETGRSHQLRAHLAAIGHPIVGDADYGGRPLLLSEHKRGYKLRRGVPERPLLDRMFLHSDRLEFVDLDGAACCVTAELPADLSRALQRLDAAHANRRTTNPRND